MIPLVYNHHWTSTRARQYATATLDFNPVRVLGAASSSFIDRLLLLALAPDFFTLFCNPSNNHVSCIGQPQIQSAFITMSKPGSSSQGAKL